MARERLFDLAVNRAHRYARSLGLELSDPAVLRAGLELWYLKTRFAYRIPLSAILECLSASPGEGYSWRGGPEGSWRKTSASGL